MTLGTPHLRDTIAFVGPSGVIINMSAAEALAFHGASKSRTSTHDFSMHHNGVILHFRAGVPVVCDAALITALAAASAPVT